VVIAFNDGRSKFVNFIGKEENSFKVLLSVYCSLLRRTLLLLLAHDSGTVYLLTSSLPHHSRHFARN